MSNDDLFSDVRKSGDLQGFGTLAGDGVSQHYRAEVSPRPDGGGINIMCSCDQCGQRQEVSVDWPEVIVISFARGPRGWRYVNGTMQPELGCVVCRTQLGVGLTADECKKLVNSGLQAGKLNPQVVQNIAAQLKGG